MELVAGATHQHATHGTVRIETIYREYGVYDDITEDGHIPGAWYVAYSPSDGDKTHIDLIEDFLDATSR